MLEGNGEWAGMGCIDLNQFKYESQDVNPNRVSDLKYRLEPYAVDFLQHILPDGRVRGKEYVVGTLEGGRGKSTSISLAPGKIGVGSDFATGEKTGDLIDVYKHARNLDFVTTLEEIEDWLGLYSKTNTEPSNFLPAGFDTNNNSTKKSITYTYKDYDENTILTINRIEYSNGHKEFYPQLPDGSKSLPENNRPLYNLPGIKESDTVVLVEGEKCADYLISLGYTATTCIGGANAPLDKTDFGPLKNKNIVLWPDNDDGGKKLAKREKDLLEEMDVPSLQIIQLPVGVPNKWDAADCTPEKVKSIIDTAKTSYKKIDIMLFEYSAKSYDTNPIPRQFLIEGGFALNSCSILAAEGGTGKSFMFLDLAVKVAYGLPLFDQSFGGTVLQSGNVIYLSAEDGRQEIHERINLVDKGDPIPRRMNKDSKYELRIIPMPSLGTTFPLFYIKNGILAESDNWSRIRESILNMSDVKLIILDPLAMLVHADVNSDPLMGSMVCAEFNRLAVETNSSVLISHHFSKGNYDVAIESAEQARQHVRGTTALVDSARNTFCIWGATKKQAQESCERTGTTYERNLIYWGATVKSNYLTENAIKVLKRNKDTGVLECIEKNYDLTSKEDIKRNEEEVEKEIVRIIKRNADHETPYNFPGRGSKSINKSNLTESTQSKMRTFDTLQNIVNKLLVKGKIVRGTGIYSGQLDVCDGKLARKWKSEGMILDEKLEN